MKKALKIGLIVVTIIIVAAVGLAIWQWDTISIVMNNAKVSEAVDTIPEPAIAAVLPLTKDEADWPCWRGSNGDGRSGVTGISTDWSAGLEKKWEIEYLCQGGENAAWSAPVIQGNRLVVCGRDSTHDLVFCLNPGDGRLIWRASYPAEASTIYGAGSRATPWIDDDRVYTFGRNGDLVCWNLLDGSKLWHKNVNAEGGEEHTWGHSSSPLVMDSIVVVNGGGTARTIAFDKITGDVKWKSGAGVPGYAAISQMTIDGDPILLIFHGTGLTALDPKDGAELWNTPWETDSGINATTPVVTDDRVFMTSTYGVGGQLLKVNRKGFKILWQNKAISSHHSDPFIFDGYIYGYSGYSLQNKGKFKCVLYINT